MSGGPLQAGTPSRHGVDRDGFTAQRSAREGLIRPRPPQSDPQGVPLPERPVTGSASRADGRPGPGSGSAGGSPADHRPLGQRHARSVYRHAVSAARTVVPQQRHGRAAGTDPRQTWIALGIATATTTLWLLSLPSFHLEAMSGFGLLDAAPVAFYAAAALATLPYLLLAARGRTSTLGLSALHGALVLVVFGTPAVLYPEPRYAWMYKHLGVIEYFQQHGGFDREIDVYHNWPGFFVVAAAVSWVLHLDLMTMARFAEVFFGMLTPAALYYAVGGLTRDRRLRWTTVVIFTLANWIGQGYFAPQALALVLMLVFFGGVLRVMTGVRPNGDQRVIPALSIFMRKRRVRAQATAVAVPGRGGWAMRAITIAAFAALAATHQLTPAAALLQLVALGVVARLRPWWMIAVPLAIEGTWILLAWPYLHEHVKILSFDLSQNMTLPGSALKASLPGMDVAQWSGPGMMLLVGLLAVAGIVVQWRRGLVNISAIVLAAAPAAIVAMNSYGSEAIFRVYLYSLPWLAFLAAQFVVPSASVQVSPGNLATMGLRRRMLMGPTAAPRSEIAIRPGRLFARQVIVAALLLPLSLVACFFLEKENIIVPADLRTAAWFEQHTGSTSYAVMVAPSYPTRLTAQYPEHIVEDGAFAPAVTSWMEPTGRAEDAIAGAQKAFRYYSWRPGYLVFTPSQRNFAQMWGLMTAREYDRFEALVAKSSTYQVVYQQDGGLIARYLGSP